MFYPRQLRHLYRDQILQTLHDAYRNRTVNAVAFWSHAYIELFQASVREHLLMLRENAFFKPLVIHTLTLAVVLTVLGVGLSLTMDQLLRRGADQPQVDLADWYVGEIDGQTPTNWIPLSYVDMDRSLQPVVIFYDDQGHPTTGTGYLDHKLPAPPPGVFAFAREHGVEKFTWQPRPGVRLATVVKHVSGKTPGFVLAGRSLRLVESQKSFLHATVLIVWIVMMALLCGGAIFLNRSRRPKPLSA